MTCQLWRVMTSWWRDKPAILNLRPPSWIPSLQSYGSQWRHWKICEFVLGKILNQNKHKKAKDYLFLTKKKTEKKTVKKRKIAKIHSWEDGCYANVNHHRHVIDTGKFSLINFRKSHKIWWLFGQPFKSYSSLKSERAQSAPPPRLNKG